MMTVQQLDARRLGSSPRRASLGAPDRLLIVLPLIFLSVGFLYPLGHTVWSSFSAEAPLAAYREVLSDQVFLGSVWRSLSVSLICTLLCLLIGYPMAYEITRPATRTRSVLLFVIVITFWVSVLIRAYSWVVILEPHGIFNSALTGLGLISNPLEIQGSVTAVVIGMTHYLLPYMVLILIPTLRAVDPSTIAAAQSLGANRRQAFRRVVLPLSLGGIAAGCLLTFILSIGFFIMPAILGGPALPFVANSIGEQVGMFQNFSTAAAMGVILTCIVVALYLLMLRFVDPTDLLGHRKES